VKIGFLLTGPNGGGAERAMINVANYLAHNSEHRVLLFLGSTTGPMRDAIDREVQIVDLGARRARSILGPLGSRIRSERPDVLVSALMICDLIALVGQILGRWQVKIVISVQNDPLARARGSRHGIQRHWPTLIKLLYRRADSVSAISSGVATAVADLLGRPRESVPVIYNPVVSAGFEEKLEEKPDHPWFHDGTPVILAAGRLIRQKDYPVLLRAFAQLVGRKPARLIVIGEGEDRGSLERLAAELGIADRVAMPGFVANPYAWMKYARLFVLSSQWEGFGNVLAEALACGTPVVATDCPSGPAEILDGGAYGRLVPVGDATALADAMEEALDARVDHDRLIARGMQFDVERIGPQYQALIESVADR
jgi:glycosyltransferase involved in cell wall biosynthesis